MDFELFSEMRSNIQLIAGEHYIQRSSRFWSRIRDTRQLQQREKLRLTKNHLARITKTYINSITSHNPGITILPKNEREIQDQKAAELNKSVWMDIEHRHNFAKRKMEWAKDFIEIGECAVKIFFDPNKGKVIGYAPKMVKHPGMEDMPAVDPQTGQMMPDKNKPILSGDFVFDRIWGFNLMRDSAAKTMEESRFLCYRKLVDIDELKSQFDPQDPRQKYIIETGKDTFNVFEGSTAGLKRTKNMALVREFYFRANTEYPNGWYTISTTEGILWEGEIPFGIFPIVITGFDEISTSPRSRSIVKQLRPIQAEVNRAASKIAEHQITLGDDKLLIQSGSKIAQGTTLAGVRTISYQGMTPTHLPGRTGEQYMGYLQNQIQEMYDLANIREETEEKSQNADPYSMLFASLRHKKKFSYYSEKFERYLIEVAEKSLILAKHYYPDQMLVPAIGRHEYINIDEFKKSEDLSYQIKVEAQVEDIETKLGKTLVMNHILQYVGNKLETDELGKIMRAMPYTNNEKIFEDFTQDYDNITNDILALDRGKYRPAQRYDKHKYVIKSLVSRMKQSDFEFMSPQIQQLYQAKLQEHEMMEVQNLQKLQQSQAGFIPSGGFLVACDFYVKDPQKPSRQRRARIPSESVKWLIDKLQAQGSSLKDLEKVQQGAQVDIAEQLNQQQPQPEQPLRAVPTDIGAGGVF